MWWLPDDHPGPCAADLVTPVRNTLDASTRDTILTIEEAAAAQGEATQGVWVHQAVPDHGIRTYDEFRVWQASTSTDVLTSWRPHRD